MNLAVELAIRSSIVAVVGLAAALAMRGITARARVLTLRGVCLLMIALPVLLLLGAKVEVPNPLPAAPVVTAAPYPTTLDVATQAPAAEVPVWPLVWVAGILLVAARHLAASGRLRKMWRSSRDADTAVSAELADAMLSMKVRHQPRARMGDTPTPLVFGLAARMLLPSSFPGWLAERRRLALLHEAAHIRHRDALWAHLGYAVAALYWWNPLSWALTRSLRVETELAADEAAIQAGFPGVQYAQTLLAIAQDSPVQAPVYACSLLGVGTLGRRVRAALRPASPRSRFLSKTMMLTTALLVVTTALGGFADPQSAFAPSAPAPVPAPQDVAPVPAKVAKPAKPALAHKAPRPAKAAKPAKPAKPAKAPKVVRYSVADPFAKSPSPRKQGVGKPSAKPADLAPRPSSDDPVSASGPAGFEPGPRPTSGDPFGASGPARVEGAPQPTAFGPIAKMPTVDDFPSKTSGFPAIAKVRNPNSAFPSQGAKGSDPFMAPSSVPLPATVKSDPFFKEQQVSKPYRKIGENEKFFMRTELETSLTAKVKATASLIHSLNSAPSPRYSSAATSLSYNLRYTSKPWLRVDGTERQLKGWLTKKGT